MSQPIGMTDPRVVKAYSHPLRVRIHSLLQGRVASPSDIAAELDVPLPMASYHVRRLRSLGLIELVERVTRRGAIEHRYTARYHLVASDDEWGALPKVAKRAYMNGALEFGWAHLAAAVQEGAFDRRDIHYSRTCGRVDDSAWHELAEVLKETLARIERIVDASERRFNSNGTKDAPKSTVIMMHFAGPSAEMGDEVAHLDGLRLTTSAAIRAAQAGREDK